MHSAADRESGPIAKLFELHLQLAAVPFPPLSRRSFDHFRHHCKFLCFLSAVIVELILQESHDHTASTQCVGEFQKRFQCAQRRDAQGPRCSWSNVTHDAEVHQRGCIVQVLHDVAT